MIKVKGYAFMRKYTVDLPTVGELDVPEATTVDSVLKQLKPILPPRQHSGLYGMGFFSAWATSFVATMVLHSSHFGLHDIDLW